MLFTSSAFVLFCLGTFVTYYWWARGADGGRQVALLLVASIVFYSFSDIRLAVLLCASLLFNGTLAWVLSSGATEEKESRRRLVALGVTANLLLLGFFKYALFFVELLLPEGLESRLADEAASIPLPIGVSFYTFQGISLVVDLGRGGKSRSWLVEYRKKGPRAFFSGIGLYLAFFPQLIAGPIVKAHDFLPQIGPRSLHQINWPTVVRALVGGFFLKLVVADNLAEATVILSAGDFEGRTRIDLLLLVFGYSCQIFADFAGYSLIAIGLGALFGYRLPVNFRSPYASQSITEFWRRWHISLSSWLREYLYIPLGGNRRGASRTYVNLLLVMVLGGLWHGSELNFAFWGLAHGVLLALERLLFGGTADTRSASQLLGAVRAVSCFGVVSLLWLLFVTPDFESSEAYFRTLLSAPFGWNPLEGTLPLQAVFAIVLFSIPVVLHHVHAFRQDGRSAEQTTTERDSVQAVKSRRSEIGVGTIDWVESVLLGGLLFLIVSDSGISGEFIYFQF